MTEPLAPAELVNPEELVALRRDAQRYRWLRTHAVRIQGSEIWYAGDALDIRVDVGVEHIALAACRTFPLAGRIAHRSWNLTV